MNLNEKMKFNRNREGKGNTFSSIIEKLNDYKDHLVIDTDGEVWQNKEDECDKMMDKISQQFKFETLYLINAKGYINLSVLSLFHRGYQHRTVLVKEIDWPEIELRNLREVDHVALNENYVIQTYDRFYEIYQRLENAVVNKRMCTASDDDLKKIWIIVSK